MPAPLIHRGRPALRWVVLLLGLLLIAATATARQVPHDTTSAVTLRAPAEDVRAAYRDDPAFQYANEEPAGEMGLKDRLRAWLADYLGALDQATGNVLTLAILIGLAGLGAALIVQLFMMRSRRPWHRAGTDAASADRFDPEPSGPPDYRARAEAARRSGQTREAVRWLHRALLQALAQADLITYHPDKTNGAYVRAVRERAGAPLADEVARATRHFEYVWYGGFEATEAEIDTLQSAIDQIHTTATPAS